MTQLTLDIELMRPGAVRTIQRRIDAENSLKWIRFREPSIGGRNAMAPTRFHAVWAEEGAGYWTLCNRFATATGVKESTDSPRARCACCMSRLRHPYLIPEALLAMRGEA